MAITPQQIAAAKLVQDAAAHDISPTVRLVAGPGTGKSFAIEERASWLLGEQAVSPSNIIAVSFTRAASKDLKDRIYAKCNAAGHGNVERLRVSTLHSLALWILRRTGNLAQYPVAPAILDDWESKNIFDAEYGNLYNLTPTRCEEIRADHEAFWNTGIWNPPNLPQPDIEISEEERNRFNGYYVSRTQAFSCVLPGEVVRRCVELVQQGLIDAVEVLGVQHLIVDEVQDFNPCDFEFIDALIDHGVIAFIAGDDDQSVYSFRHAFPQGIQNFANRYPNTGDHVLNDCFRCTPQVLASATSIINNFPSALRIPKNLSSLYVDSDPPNNGHVFTKTFGVGNQEAAYVANSCSALVAAGVNPKDIIVLVGNKRTLLKTITNAFDLLEGDNAVKYDANSKHDFIESDSGRFVMAGLRIALDDQDYVAHRVILGVRRNVGIGTCRSITDKVINSNLNYRNLFYGVLPNVGFNNRELNAITAARENTEIFTNWGADNTLAQRNDEIAALLEGNFAGEAVADWTEFISDFPDQMNLQELRDYFYSSSLEYRTALLNSVYERLDLPYAEGGEQGDRVRIMSFHSSKGLSGKVVFIPGLEELVFPTRAVQLVPGRVLEAARLLYVAITRAKGVCILSRTLRRTLQGRSLQMTPSRFCAALNRPFTRERALVISADEVARIQGVLALL